MSEKHDPYSSLRFQRFRRFLIASALVRMGTAAQGLAIGWEMYDRTGQALSLGMVGLVQAIPMLLFTLPAGYLADVFDRRKLMMLSLAGATLTSLGLAVFSWYQFPTTWMYALLFLDSSLLRIGSPAQRAITPLLVPDELFENAAKWSTSLMQITGIAGPAIGGFVIAFNIQAAYVLSAFSSLGFILFLTTMTLPPAPRSEHGNMFGQIAEGLRYVHDQKLLLGAISLDLFAVLLGGAVYLLPIFARDIIDLETVGLSPEAALGWLRAAPAVGACIIALLMAYLPPIRHAGRTLLLCVAGFGAATIVFGLSQNFWLSLVMLALTGAFDNVSMVIRRVISQMSTPNQMRGRVQAVTAIFVGSSNEIGGFESGVVAQVFTPVISVISGGIGTLLVVASWTGLFPSLRKLGSLSSLTQEERSTTPTSKNG
ncbi:MAG: MFS transporter [Candidatus Latescibacterota bacterium]|nr:MFS transporter [Candidatus Latescibacterota bacterium]